MSSINIPPPFSTAHLALGYFVLEFEHLHGVDHALHRHENVLVDELGEAAPVLIRVAHAVNDAHLFDERGLPRLPRPCGDKQRMVSAWRCSGACIGIVHRLTVVTNCAVITDHAWCAVAGGDKW